MLKFLVLAFLAFSFLSLGQKDPCLSSDLKYKKLLAKAISQETYENQTKKFSALISKYPNYAEAYFIYARLTMRECEIKNKNCLIMAFGPGMLRMVTHLDISFEDIDAFCSNLKKLN